MKKTLFTLLLSISFAFGYSQNYSNILNYNFNGTPTNGVKIKTNIPYSSGTQMPTITVQGYNYGTASTIGLTIVYYIYNGGFVNYQVSSFGNHTPPVYLSIENNKVVIYLDDRVYYQRFTASVYAQNMSEQATWFQGWTTADEALAGSATVLVPYANKFAGDVTLPGSGIWNAIGDVGIGTLTPDPAFKLSVNGSIRSKEVKVETGWSDYVFDDKYKLRPISEVETYIKLYHHLPDVPSAVEVEKNGILIGETSSLLLKKIEELTLYLIEKNKQVNEQAKQLIEQQKAIKSLQDQINKLAEKK